MNIDVCHDNDKLVDNNSLLHKGNKLFSPIEPLVTKTLMSFAHPHSNTQPSTPPPILPNDYQNFLHLMDQLISLINLISPNTKSRNKAAASLLWGTDLTFHFQWRKKKEWEGKEEQWTIQQWWFKRTKEKWKWQKFVDYWFTWTNLVKSNPLVVLVLVKNHIHWLLIYIEWSLTVLKFLSWYNIILQKS